MRASALPLFVFSLASLLGVSTGFISGLSPFGCSATRESLRNNVLGMTKTQLNEIDYMCILNTAEFCVEGECSLDDVDALVNQLEDQRDIFAGQLRDLDKFLADIGLANVEQERDVAFMRGRMRSVAGLFETEGP